MQSCVVGDKVRILTSELEDDPNLYTVDDLFRQVVYITCQDTGRQVKVHKSRIRKILKENDMSDTDVVMETETDVTPETEETSEVSQPKEKKVRRPKSEPVSVDFDSPPFAGLEVWTKGDCEFDVATVNVAAHCALLEDGYQTFNTYNGTLGKKGTMPEDGSLPGVFYSFTEKMTLEKKRELLSKKGYTKRQ